MPKIHRHQKLANWLWEGGITLAWHPGKCRHVASRHRWVWKLFRCLCMVFGLDKEVSLDGSALLFCSLGSVVTKHLTGPVICVFRDLLLQLSPSKLLGCLSNFTVCIFNFLEVYKPLEGHLCQQFCRPCLQQSAQKVHLTLTK